VNTSDQTKIKRPEISIVIPVFNERENLVLLDEQITKHMKQLNKDYEVILVDDGSNDGSAEVIRILKNCNSRLRLIQFGHNHGQTAAFSAGFDKARGDTIITMDADLQNSPADIPLLLEAIKEYDVVCGWRYKRNDPWIKKISSKIANTVRNSLTEETIKDTGCSLKAFRRECFKNIKFYNGMHRFFPTLMKMEGFSVTQVKVDHYPRIYGRSKYNIRNRLFASFKDLLAIRWMKKRQIKYDIVEED
jgi:glycosyltransferase involved in cell wall biosynthesis